jgi:chemotaxis protein MotB
VPNGPIIIKKKGGHGGHHGGAWKVAYADFVTAMMSLFIVLWLLSSSKPVQEAVGGYFRDPSGTSKLSGTTKQGAAESLDIRKEDMKKIKEALEKQIKALPDFEKLKKNIDMKITSEGLRIELSEGDKATFFEVGSAVPSESGKELLKALAEEVGKLPNQVSIEGHTDSKPYSGGQTGYSNWELSVDRSNAARRIVQSSGLQPNQVSQVRGFADQRPREHYAPDDPANRRISLIVQYASKAGDADADDSPKAEGSSEKKPSTEGEKKPAGEGEKKH